MKTQVSAQAKKMAASLALIAIVASTWAAPAWAATQTVTLSVSGMTCAACPITVKKAFSKVDGVQEVNVSYKKLEAVVTFDDAKTTVEALTKATENAGYPASVKQ
ncbi:Mercuric transport protein periplasmic component [Nitrosomonas nitrosa]|uniref:Periplasmic mercury ion-binding protein n=1 Tax=Nitrosomonas nitrosa TaxID=52442 RepID=A0A8H8YY14_9PROT|nr:mercury resistance system periplasmic binding protein MerP [Nitrosomonas nitrosa]CAE6497476.1 Mercuric transport protein periplasmic component [Nitrosomonas nitrosa]